VSICSTSNLVRSRKFTKEIKGLIAPIFDRRRTKYCHNRQMQHTPENAYVAIVCNGLLRNWGKSRGFRAQLTGTRSARQRPKRRADRTQALWFCDSGARGSTIETNREVGFC
jgi:hypothetical protein